MHTYILNFAPTGMVPTKALNSHTPISVSEIVEDVLCAAEFGASIAHLHARDADSGAPVVCPDVYGKIIEGIRRYHKTLVLCVSLSGRNVSDPCLRAAPLNLTGAEKPDMGSLTLSSLNFAKQASVNAPGTIDYLAGRMKELGIAPELEIFDLGMANYVAVLQKKHLLPAVPYTNILLGNIFGAQVSPAHLAALTTALPGNMMLSVAGLGDYQLDANVMGLACGYGVRIGLEDNLWQDRQRKVLASNHSLLKRITSIAGDMGRHPLPADRLRAALGLQAGSGEYGVRPDEELPSAPNIRQAILK